LEEKTPKTAVLDPARADGRGGLASCFHGGSPPERLLPLLPEPPSSTAGTAGARRRASSVIYVRDRLLSGCRGRDDVRLL